MEKQDLETLRCPVCGRAMREKMAAKQSDVGPYLGKPVLEFECTRVGTSKVATNSEPVEKDERTAISCSALRGPGIRLRGHRCSRGLFV
jgi:hypothetical protein